MRGTKLERENRLKIEAVGAICQRLFTWLKISDLFPLKFSSNMAYTTGQTWGALRKAWKAYRIAKVQNSNTDMVKYATRIRSLQAELGVSQASFPDLNLG